MSDNLRAVIDYYTQQILLQSKRPLFLAITGDSGSGKSFLTQLIKSELTSSGISCSGINHDDFLISRADREPMKRSITRVASLLESRTGNFWKICFASTIIRVSLVNLRTGGAQSIMHTQEILEN